MALPKPESSSFPVQNGLLAAKLAVIFENTVIGIVMTGTDGLIQVANPAFCTLLGYSNRDLAGRRIHELTHPDDIPPEVEQVRAMIRDGRSSLTFEKRYIRRDGEVIWVRVIYSVYRNAEGVVEHLTGLVEDISERKQAEAELHLREEQLKASERRYRLLFENMTAAFALHEMIYDEQGHPINYRFLEVNPAYEKHTGLSPSYLVGKTVREVLPNVEPYWIETFGHTAMTGEPIAYENYVSTWEKYYETWVFSPAKDQFAVIFTDVTRRKEIENSLRESESKFRAITEQNSEGIVLLSEDGRVLEWNAAQERITGLPRQEVIGCPVLEFLYAATLPEYQTPERYRFYEKAISIMLKTGEVPEFLKPIEMYVNQVNWRKGNSQEQSGASPLPPSASPLPPGASLLPPGASLLPPGQDLPAHVLVELRLFPIKTEKGYRFGVITRDVTEVRSTERQIQRLNEELVAAYDATLLGWSRFLDLRDKETEGHSQRVMDLSVRLAEALGLGEEDCLQVRRGALLHDIGKMGIPDSVLLKPASLNEEEWVLMRQHPSLAYHMLSPIPYLERALEIPYCHHEQWNGGGYPRGLKGEEIPLAARIFSVVDVWDALSNDRPYRPAWPTERVIQYLLEQRGHYFDPNMVDVFLEKVVSRDLFNHTCPS